MHRDKKIGFALGILLLGIVAAFFFRNEPDPFAELPPLDDPAALDGQIAENPVGPYTEDANAPIVKGTGDLRDNQWELPEIYRPAESQAPQGTSLPVSPGAPEPINLAEPVPAPANNANSVIEIGSPFGATNSPPPAVPELPGNESWTTVPEKPATAEPQPPATQPPAKVVGQKPPAAEAPALPKTMYRIKQGDTLSVLAETHLGSSRRYMEIYEANRDKLRNPDDIKIGMLIRIPARVNFQNQKKPAQPGTSTTAQPAPSENLVPSPEEATRFRPFSRSPLAPLRQ